MSDCLHTQLLIPAREVEEPAGEEPLKMSEDSSRNKKKCPVSKMSEKPQKPGANAPIQGQRENHHDDRPPDLKETDETFLSKEDSLQENTVSSSLKLEEIDGSKARKSRDGHYPLKKEKPNHGQETSGSPSRQMPLGDEEIVSRQHPEANKIGLDVEKNLCVARDNDKAAARHQSKKVALCLGPVSGKGLDFSAPCGTTTPEKRLKKEITHSLKREKEVHHKTSRGPEKRLASGSQGNPWDQNETFGGAKEARVKVKEKEKESKRTEGEGKGKKGKPSKEKDIKTELASDSESWQRSGQVGEEAAERRCEEGLPSKVKAEHDSEEEKPAKRRKSKAEEKEGRDQLDEKAPRASQSQETEAMRKGSRKRKAKEEEEEGVKQKKQKEESNAEEDDRWKWWEEEKRVDGVKWQQLVHKGPYFAPCYEPLPDNIHFCYNGKPMKLSLAAEEVATFFAKMLDHEYTSKETFRNNFFNDWIKEMTPDERKKIKDLEKCNFTEIHKYFVEKHEAQKALPKEEKKKLKEAADKIQAEYGYCIIDGHREKIGNFKTEPPGLFRGRGDHPKMGMLKRRIVPEDVIINCSKDSKIPSPPPGRRWKEVRCDNTVTWLASWTENILGGIKYIMLNPSSKLKGEKDWQKYEVARHLKGVVQNIRSQYRAQWKSKDMKICQRAVALYFIDKLALRAGNEKEEGETADTVGCCSLRVEHITLHDRLDGKENIVEFDFLGKDSIRYYNKVPVEKQVFKNLRVFMKHKDPGDDLFDRLSTTSLNKHLQDLMDGLTAKVFRTYNASITLQEQLNALTNEDDNVAAKLLSYNRANRAVAILCNHQRTTPKTFEKSMQNLQAKIDAKTTQLHEAKVELKRAKADHKAKKNVKSKAAVEKKKKLLERIEEQLARLNIQATDKEENKQIALGTSKLNYLDPRISVAWCKKFGVPIEKIYNKTQREKFAWAIAMADEDFEF